MGRTRLYLIAVAFIVWAPALLAQNAVVLGTVYDGKGQAMPGVAILLENGSTGFARVATTGADGSYTIPEVPPADGYVITANRADGSELDKRGPFSVNVGDERSILPPLREPVAVVAGTDAGGTATPGTAAAPLPAQAALPTRNIIVPTEKTTSIGGVITGDQLRSLPLYNRNFLVLGLLTSNTHDVEAGSGLAGASFSISGQRPSSNSFLLDGADNVASSSNQALPFQVNDAIQEFRVTSSMANAEYGRGSGGVVSVVTRRGTNQVHGAAFGYFANDVLNADNPLSVYKGTGFDRAATYAGSTSAAPLPIPAAQGAAPSTYNQYVATAQANGFCTNSITVAGAPNTCAGTTRGRNDRFNPAAILAANDRFKQPFDSKQFGANIGGPIKKDRIFAFASYEATRINNPTPVFERVPSAFDRQPRGPAGNRNYAFARNVLALYPTANVVAVPGVLEFFQGEAPNYTNVHNVLLRSDYARSSKNNFNFRYAGQLLDQLHDATLPKQSQYVGNGAIRRAQNQNGAFTWNHSFSDRLLNETRIGVSQFRVTDKPQDFKFDARTLGFASPVMPAIQLSGLDTQYSGAAPGVAGAFGGWYDSFWATTPTVPMLPSLDGQFPFARLGAPFSAPSVRRDTTWSAANNLTWTRGNKHSFKFGGDFRFVQNRVNQGGFARGTVVSSNIGEFTSDSATCNTALVGGVPCRQAFRAPSFDYALNQQTPFDGLFDSFNYSGYAQDTWKIHKKVTINVGGRYEFFGVPEEVNNQIWNYDPDANGLVQQNGTNVFDPYGYNCRPGVVTPRLDSVVRDRSFGQQQNWTCNSSGNGKMLKSDFGNFGGRFGFAWDMKGDGSTVIRGGVGIFYDQIPVSYMSQLLYNRPTQLNLANPRYIYGQNFLGTFVPGAPTNNTAPQGNPGLACQQCGMGNATVALGAVPLSDPNAAFNLQSFYQSAASPFVLYARDYKNSRTPYTRQTNLTIQQQVTDRIVVEAGYIGAAARRLPFVVNKGFNNEWFCTNSKIPVTGSGAPPGSTQPVCDTFSYFPIFTMANQAESNYHSLMFKTRMTQFHGLRLNATYSWAKSLDNASSGNFPLVPTPLFTQAFGLQFFGLGNPFGFSLGQGGTVLGRQAGSIGQTGTIAQTDTFSSSVTTTGAGAVIVSRYSLPQDPQNALKDEYGRSDFDNKHRFVADFNYDIPFAKDNKWLGGWQLAGIFAAQTGQPFTIFSGPVFGELTQRVNATTVTTTGDPNAYISGSFTLPARVNAGGSPATSCGYATGVPLYQGTIGRACTGTSRRNAFTGPAFISLDMAMQKGFKLFGEGKELTFRTEVFNLFNRANYYNPISIVSLDGFTANPDFGKIKSAQNPRQLQFAIRFTF